MVYTTKVAETVRSWASYDSSDNSLSIFLLNKNQAPQNVNINLNGYTNAIDNECWILKGASPQSRSVTWNKSDSAFLKGSKIKTKLEPLSVTIIAFPSSKLE